jgi:hypothetical protein
MREPVNRILSIIADVRRQALLCRSTSSAERGPAGAAGDLQGHTPEGVGTKKCVGIPMRDRYLLPSSRQMGEIMCEIEDVGIGHWIHHIRLSATYEGKIHDKTMAKLVEYTLPPDSGLYQDMGFQGYILAGVTIFQPKKKPRGGELTPPEKANNRRISSIRIRIEHAIGGVKRYRIVKDKIRLLKDGIRDTIMETCCGLHNFRLQYRPWHYAT